MKLKIETLLDIFKSFHNTCEKNHFDATSTDYFTQSVYFEYDGKIWKGSVTRQQSFYGDLDVLFINIRLPNDGFLYTREYLDNNSSVQTDVADSPEMIEFLATIVDTLGLQSFVDKIEPMYFLGCGRFLIKVWNSLKTVCYTVNYEYDTHFGYRQEHPYDLNKVLSCLKNRKNTE